MPNGRPQRPVTSFEGPPGKAGFRVSDRLLLGGGPPLFDQLLDGLAAVPQSLALLKLVKQGDYLTRQRDDELVISIGSQAATVGAMLVQNRI